MRHLLALLSLLSCIGLAAQVRLNGSLVLTGDDANVSGLTLEAPADALLPFELERSGQHRSAQATATGPGPWNVALEALPNGPEAGTSLLILSPTGANGPVSIVINDGPSLPVLIAPEDTLNAANIVPGSVLHVVYDGAVFHLLNGRQDLYRNCTVGQVMIGDRICMEVTERTAASFEVAAITCANSGGRMCSWADLVTGCLRRTELGLLQMTNDLEWTASSANEDGSARVALGSNCQQLSAANTATASYTFRCCITR
jgi:hypothetical protein